MRSDIQIIDEVIKSLYDYYEQEQAYAQRVISAWTRIKNKYKESNSAVPDIATVLFQDE